MKRNLSLTPLVTFVLIFAVGVSVSACGGGSQKWKEEVKLSDGRIIVVERELVFEGGGDEWASNRRGIKPKTYRIRFAYPVGSGKVIEWRSQKVDDRNWPEIPLIFDVESGDPTIFSLVAISTGCEVYSKYVYQNGAWVEKTLPDKFEQRATNLFFGNGSDLPTFVDLKEKKKRNSGEGYRRALTHVGPTRKVCG
jgi:hypothetical protein